MPVTLPDLSDVPPPPPDVTRVLPPEEWQAATDIVLEQQRAGRTATNGLVLLSGLQPCEVCGIAVIHEHDNGQVVVSEVGAVWERPHPDGGDGTTLVSRRHLCGGPR